MIVSKSWPPLIGAEDSGHLVLASPHPEIDEEWSLVGDGAATLILQLLVRATLYKNEKIVPSFQRGWKKRVSIKGTDRSKWTGDGKLADAVENIIINHFIDENSSFSRKKIDGETSLLLLKGHVNGIAVSIGIRNSGTEEKTSLSIRAIEAIDGLNGLSESILAFLTKELVHSSSDS